MSGDHGAVRFPGSPRDPRSSPRDSGDDGSQVDDSRSWCSKSDAGSLSGVPEAPREHVLHSSARSLGSVGSVESHPRHASHIVNGETRFPTAMSYMSDAQRSDAATICSSSIVEDIELESVMSQEDHHTAHQDGSHARVVQRVGATTRVVEFADVSEAVVYPPQGALHPVLQKEGALHSSTMGPPLSRALLLQKAERGTLSQTGSVKSFGSNGAHSDDCGGSLDVEAHSVHSHEDGDAKPARAESVKSTGSTDEGDCADSLDVETHSIETRSVLSQEGVGLIETPVEEKEVITTATLPEDLNINGRQSPGGTIYKGRGVRRYQGRYMNLPLKRFHQNGVHLDGVVEEPRRSRSRSRSPSEERKPRARDGGEYTKIPGYDDRLGSSPRNGDA